MSRMKAENTVGRHAEPAELRIVRYITDDGHIKGGDILQQRWDGPHGRVWLDVPIVIASDSERPLQTDEPKK